MSTPLPLVSLVGHDGMLFVSPPIPELQEELKFWSMTMHMKEATYFDRKQGRAVTRMVQDGYRGEFENLFSIMEDESNLITHEGLFHRCTKVLKAAGYDYHYRRTTPLPEFEFGPSVVGPMWSEEEQKFLPMRPEQIEAVIHLLAASGCGQKGNPAPPAPGSAGAMANLTMSTGKTFLIAALIRALRDHELVITTYRSSVVRRLYEGLNEALKHDGLEVGILTGQDKRPSKYTVCTDAMLTSFDPDKIRGILFDEVHRAGADGTSRDLLAFKNAVKFGFSGTIKGHAKEKFIESIFGPIAYEFDDAAAEKLDRVSKVKCYVVSIPDGPDVAGRSGTLQERHGITNNPFRNRVIAEVAKLTPDDLHLAIYVRTIEHIKVLQEHYLPPGFTIYHAELPEKEKREIEARIYDGTILRLLANSAFSEGVDTTTFRVLLNADWTTTDQSVSQRAGRNRRKHEDKALGIIIELGDDWGQKKRLEWLKGLKELGQDPQEKEKRSDPLYNRAQKRLKRYRDRGWPIIEIDSAQEIRFSEIYANPKDHSG